MVSDKQPAKRNKPLASRGESFGGNKRSAFDGFEGDDDLAWFITAGGAAMGERGTLAGVVSVLELGGGDHGGVPNTHPYSDQQVGLGPSVVGLVERHRWLSAAWRLLTRETQCYLLACYTAPRSAYRTDQGFGARDRCPPVEELQRGNTAEPQRGSHREVRTGVENQLGELASLAFLVIGGDDEQEAARECAQLLRACQNPGKGDAGKTIRRALKRARDVAKEAHHAWAAAKAEAPKPRRWSDRKAILGRHTPGDRHGGEL